MNEELLLKKIENIVIWKKEGQTAPHKPLLLLYALAQLKNHKARFLPYIEVKEKLTFLLEKYGPSRQSYHPDEPFVRLANDGIWELTPKNMLEYRNPSNSYLIKNNVCGGFTEEVYRLFIENTNLIKTISGLLLDKHFPDTNHEDILSDVGLETDDFLEVDNLDNGEFKLEQKQLDETIEHIKDRSYYVWETIEKKKISLKTE